MKKTFSVLLSLVMLFAVCVPAFAVDQTIQKPGTEGTATLSTDGTVGGADGTYTVTYPATVEIPWNTKTATLIQYRVSTQLVAGKTLSVKVAPQGESKLTAKTAGNNHSLAYTLAGDMQVQTADAVVNNNYVASITIAEEQWNNAAIDAYEGTLTFTVAVV